MGNPRWRHFRSCFRETDLWVAVDAGCYSREMEVYVMDRILFYRAVIEDHICHYTEFRDSLVPVMAPAGVHPLVRDMYLGSQTAGTGPMSAVAGAISQYIAEDLRAHFNVREVVIENGGDIFLVLSEPSLISVYAGASPLSEKIALVINPHDTPLSVCCSSGTTGHSLSFGTADACMIACRSGALADAYATARCNEVKNKNDVGAVTDKALNCSDIMSVVIIKDDVVGVGGSLEIKLADRTTNHGAGN